MEFPAYLLLSLVAGALLPVQAGANAQLSKTVGSPFAATTLQLLVAALVLGVMAAASGSLGTLAGLSDVPWWHAVGGLASALYVAAGILLFPRLGAVVTVGLFIAGQMLASVGLDALGVLGVAPRTLDATTAAGTLAVLAGTVAIVRGQAGGEGANGRRSRWALLALVAGAILPIQGAINALLRADLGAPLVVGATSFIVATMGMALVFVVAALAARASRPQLRALPALPWWGWLGGLVGAGYVVTVFSAMPRIGAAATVGLTIAGQQLVSMLVDHRGLMRLPRRPISKLRLAGIGLLLLGVAFVLLP